MKDEILQELAKLAAQKLHSDPSTLLDIFIGEELYVVEFYGYNSIYDAEVKSISWGEECKNKDDEYEDEYSSDYEISFNDERFADDEDLKYFDGLLEIQLYLYE